MPYRSPDYTRIAAQQFGDVYRYGGYPATWRQYISASAAQSNAAGLGMGPTYREQTITALFGPISQPEVQTPAGVFAAAQVLMTTREKIGRSDEIIWRGVRYHIQAVPTPDPLTSGYNAIIERTKL